MGLWFSGFIPSKGCSSFVRLNVRLQGARARVDLGRAPRAPAALGGRLPHARRALAALPLVLARPEHVTRGGACVVGVVECLEADAALEGVAAHDDDVFEARRREGLGLDRRRCRL
jgi:hypothetical protein